MDLKLCINQMIEYTRKFKAVQSNPQIMIDEINELDTSIIEEKLNNEYSDDMSDLIVNQYRKDLLIDLVQGKKITLDEIDDFIVYRKSQKRFQWSNHAIISGLYYILFDVKLAEQALKNNLNEIFVKTKLVDDYIYSKEFNLRGSRNFGSSFYAISFLTEKFKSGQNNNQLTFQIDDKITVFYYDAVHKQQHNVSEINIDSPTLEVDIINGFIHASKTIEGIGGECRPCRGKRVKELSLYE